MIRVAETPMVKDAAKETNECWQPPEAGGGVGGLSPGAFGGSQALLKSWF